MANVINFNNHLKEKYDEQLITKIKLCRIRDEIEEKLNNYSIIENLLIFFLLVNSYTSLTIIE